jgi:Protein of unknown function (DUF5818)
MKRLFLTTIMLLLLSSWASTQTSSSSQQQPDKSKTAASDHKGQKSIEGCLSGAANTFTLTDATGKTYELIGDTSGLNQNVGHQVRISGNLDTTGGGGRISAAGEQALIEVKNVESLSDKCK